MKKNVKKLFELAPYMLSSGLGPLLRRRKCLRELGFIPHWKADGIYWFSQDGQDKFIADTIFKGKRSGCFLDIGANDGVTHSNTLALEKHFGWTGLCVEPHPEIFLRLRDARRCNCINSAAMPKDGEMEFWMISGSEVDISMLSGFRQFMTPFQVERIERNVQGGKAILERKIVQATSVPDYIKRTSMSIPDLLCIDVEGAEWFIAEHILDSGIHPSVLCIENNGMHYRMTYELFLRGYCLAGMRGGDEIYIDVNFASRQ